MVTVDERPTPSEAWILAGALDGNLVQPSLGDDLGGVPYGLRLACDLAAAGARTIYVIAIGGRSVELDAIARDPRIAGRARVEVTHGAPDGAPDDGILIVRADRVFHRDLPKLVAQAYRTSPGANLATIEGDDHDAVHATDRAHAQGLVRAAATPGGLGHELEAIAATSAVAAAPLPYRGFTVAVADRAGLRRAERRLIGSLRKAADGIAAKAINRSLSLPITRLICRTSIRPNQVTVVALVCALIGGLVIARGGYASGVAGMVLVELGSIIDGIDGELARLRFQFSRKGQWLDTIVDDVANVAYVSGVIASLHGAGVSWAMPLGILALCAFAVTQGTQYALIKYVYRSGDLAAIPWAFQSAELLGRHPTGGRAWLATTAPRLLKRDFVVTLFVGFAIAGRLDLILGVFSAGAVTFLGLFVVQLTRNRNALTPPARATASPGAPAAGEPARVVAGRRRLRVAVVSTFPPVECGIANYTRELVGALSQQVPEIEVIVLAETHGRTADVAGVRRSWNRREPWGAQILSAVDAVRPDVVHVQHEESILGQDRRLPALLSAIRSRGIGTVVTLHTVHDGWRGRPFHRRLARACDRLVVHQDRGCASVLVSHGVPEAQVSIIEHGTPALELPDRATARARLGLPSDVPIALFFGFIHLRKRLHVAVDAFEAIADRLGGARLVIAGRVRQSSIIDPFYARYLRGKLRRGVDAGRIVFRPGFVRPEDKAAYYAAADLVVLPHDQPYGSASGVLHEAIAARRAFVCTRGKKFADAVDAFAAVVPVAFPAPGDHEGWKRGLEHMLLSANRRDELAGMLGEVAEQTSWPKSASRHAAMYQWVARDFRGLPESPSISRA